jgi:hypothetical protein
VRERDKAMTMGTVAGYGRYVTFACPAYTNAVFALVPMGVLMGAFSAVGVKRLLSGGHDSPGTLPVIGLLAITALCFGGAAVLPFRRRPGGPVPRLYCFEEGVVVAHRGVLRSFRWSGVSITSRSWQSGSGEYLRNGTQDIVKAPDGSVLVTFSGEEADRAHADEMEWLHHAALRRGSGNPSRGNDT